ncbi:hypothetical protein [Aliarcobacter cryaerophilus]|jgi:hypothetical protein|uniref:Lipoprotein n=1 Tax=Arcobacter sp. AZ-2023 TaxID=3074453 RepID=A0AA96DJX8_9BACT|nr:hypothetical protein [Aliarcobacter cryaerophilus]MCT7484898.1 hypothetical protein [Aliarcobacter cryaerophilus]WNL28842.1 hypothetical protein RMQ68_05600 [Arcobacter sp. AZ-2023]
MAKFLQIAFVTVLLTFIFTGCTSITHHSLEGKIFSLNPNTLQNAKKDIGFEVSNIKLGKDLPNYFYGFLIEESKLKNSLQENLDKFYPNNSANNLYKVELNMEFKKDGLLEIQVLANAIYKIYKNENLIKTIEIQSKYARDTSNLRKDNKELVFAAYFGIPKDLENNPIFQEKYLEYTAYVLNQEIASEQEHFKDLRVRFAYAGAIRLNFAKFIQELNKVELR